MNSQNEYIDKFDRYLNDALNADEKDELEKELLNDDQIRHDFEAHKTLVDGICLHGRKSLLDKIEKWDSELENEESNYSINRSTVFRWYYAAAAIILFVVGAAIIYSTINTGHEHLVAKYYQPYEYLPSTHRGDSSTPDQNGKIFNLYDQGQYEEVVKLIGELDESSQSEIITFFNASAYQALKKYRNAIPLYEKVIDLNSYYTNGATWYLALCFLSDKQVDEAKQALNNLKETNSPYAAKAKVLLSELD